MLGAHVVAVALYLNARQINNPRAQLVRRLAANRINWVTCAGGRMREWQRHRTTRAAHQLQRRSAAGYAEYFERSSSEY